MTNSTLAKSDPSPSEKKNQHTCRHIPDPKWDESYLLALLRLINPLCLTFLASNYIFQAYLCYNMHYQLTSSSGCSQGPHHMDGTTPVSSFLTDGHLGCLHLGLLWITLYMVSVWTFVSQFSLDSIIPWEELLDHMGTWQLTFWVTVSCSFPSGCTILHANFK